MQSLPRPSRELAHQHLATAFNSQGQSAYPITGPELDNIMLLYDAYDNLSGAPDESLKGMNLDEALRSAILAAYDLTQLGRTLSCVRASLMREVEQCPICGIAPPNELDHYLPKSSFNPLSIYVRNLIPICGTCNKKKGSTVADTPQHLFVHPYFEDLPPNRFMRADVSIEDDGLLVEYEVDSDANVPIELHRRLTYQLQRLKLNERYASEINLYLVGHTTSLRGAYRSGGAAAVRTFLRMQSQVEFACFHPNHWRPVLLRSLKDHQEFCDGGFSHVLRVPDPDEVEQVANL